jgi:uncharacterized membrane protein
MGMEAGQPGRQISGNQSLGLLHFLCAEVGSSSEENQMNNIIYIVGLIVVIVAVLGFFGLR